MPTVLAAEKLHRRGFCQMKYFIQGILNGRLDENFPRIILEETRPPLFF